MRIRIGILVKSISFLCLSAVGIGVQAQAVSSDTIEDFTPVCIGAAVSFSASTTGVDALTTNPGHFYGELGSAPNPAWFYFKVKDAGTLNIAQNNSASQDVDGAFWGPFDSIPDLLRSGTGADIYPRATHYLDSDYGVGPTFNFSAQVEAGKYYVLLIANFSGAATDISMDSGAGTTATSDCDALNPGFDITLAGENTVTEENGATDTYTLNLYSAPSDSVTVNLSTLNNEVTVSPNPVVFTTSNWYEQQTITVTAVDDTIIDGNLTDEINNVASSTDANYDGISKVISSIANDNDDPDGDGISSLDEGTGDTDGDSTPDYLDTDSDGDGVPDALEGVVDSDNDGILDYLDTDSDGDGIDDAIEAGADPGTPVDTDGDGIVDMLDDDSDADGIDDSLEADVETDGDNIPDYIDTDSDNDGIDDTAEGNVDSDGDGVADYQDLDSDNDGLADILEGDLDSDGDGTPDYIDTDSDNDGTTDGNELDGDVDGDGIPNSLDSDSDNDGIPDRIEGNVDTDTDGTPDLFDSDSDNDGIPDQVEETALPALNGSDSDGDGIDDVIDVDVTGGVDTDGNGVDDTLQPVDSDGDGVADHLDADSDNDGLSDAVESSRDADDDGVANYLDLDSDNDGMADIVEAGGADANGDGRIDGFVDEDANGQSDALDASPASLPDNDNDGVANHLDLDSDNDGLSDLLESQGIGVDVNGDGQVDDFVDNDGDGLSDELMVVQTVASDTDGDGIVDHLDLDSDNDGAFDLIESGVADANYDGMIDNFADNDADGIQDNVDVDVTGGADADGDGIDDVADADFVGGLDTDLDGIIDALDVDADGNGIVDVLEDVPVLGAALPDIDNNNIPDVFEANSSDVARAALSGHGCAVSTHKHASKDPIMFLLMLIAGLFTFRQKKRSGRHTRRAHEVPAKWLLLTQTVSVVPLTIKLYRSDARSRY